jgi:signal transduction histidine kinase
MSGSLVFNIYLVFMLVAQANAMLPTAPAITGTLLFTAAWFVVLGILGLTREQMLSIGAGMGIGLLFTVTLSQVLRRYIEQTQRANQLLSQLQAANAELLAARQREKELAVAEERVRVARDLHDGLGHHLTALSIQLQAVEKLSKTQPEQAAEAARNARSEVQAALKEVRQSVGMLRQAPLDLANLSAAISSLVSECGRRSGLQARFEEEGAPPALSAATAMTLYRVAQEGLTNVQKHAQQAGQVWVRLSYQAGEVSLVVMDDGQAAADCAEGPGGFGLAGLRERAALLGGRLACGRRPEGGFFLAIYLPTGAD